MAPNIERERALVDALANAYYEVLDQGYRTGCMLTASVSCAVLEHFGVQAQVTPCQVWYSLAHHNYVVGFVGSAPQKDKWDGHVVCTSTNFLLDAALFHFKREFDMDVPWVASVQRIPVASQMMARYELPSGQSLKWLNPPPGSDTQYPEVPKGLVQELAGKLVERLQAVASVPERSR